ncbi:MAG: HAMP domain-containing protein [Xanthomonadaceae bacterium]|nr:HAMP domain-containing protein [Xanthomonadaceae bacterium]
MRFFVSQENRIGRYAAMLHAELPDVHVDPTRRIEVAGRSTPALLNGPDVLNLDCTIPDRFTASTGVTATLFVRSGNEFVRVSTSVKKQTGERAVGTTLSHAHPGYARLLSGQSYVGYATLFGTQYLTQYDPLRDAHGQIIGALYVGIDVSAERRLDLGVKLASVCFLLAALIALLLIESFSGNAERVTGTELAGIRNLHFALGLAAAAALAVAILLFVRATLTKPLREARSVAQRLSVGDLTSLIHVDRNDDMGQLMQAINGISQGLSEIVGNVREGSNEIAAASREIATGNADLSTRTSEQAASLEEVASSMTELTTAVRHTADSAEQANRLALDTSTIAAQGRKVVDDLIAGMSSIKTSSHEIERIVGEIEDIAFQTNILALNAAVEAARAGEHGRSFSVVAADVRNLAQRSGSAAKEIKTLIGDSVLKIDHGSALADAAGRTMSDVVASVKRVTDVMAEISEANRQQAIGIEQVNVAMGRMDEMTQRNAALVEEAAAAAESLHAQAERLQQAVAAFKLP